MGTGGERAGEEGDCDGDGDGVGVGVVEGEAVGVRAGAIDEGGYEERPRRLLRGAIK